ncbi:MAG: AarF/ABC1/UbiB kinase family protein [Firmicutes bacterium]|nr:AarF/ABC1/UbiB kinase family protein [Bacillota bacterium]
MAVQDRWRRLVRYRRIAQLVLTHGLRLAAREASPGRLWALVRHRSVPLDTGVRVRRLLEDLGPTFVKLGQLLSTRPDLVSADILRELEHLQDHVPPEPAAAVRRVVEGELGQKVEELFASFRWEPIAAASLGQVHAATLPDGSHVVVKVQRPGVEPTIQADLAILGDVLRLLGRAANLRDLYDPEALVDEFARGLRAELDYAREGRNAERLRSLLPPGARVVVPRVIWPYTRRRVLTLEAIEGLKPTDPERLRQAGHDPSDVARTLARAILHMVFHDGFFHADPHPGNVAVLPNGRLVLYDFGMVGRLTEDMREAFGDLSVALLRGDTEAVVDAVVSLGALPPDLDHTRLVRDVEELRDRYYEVPLRTLNMGQIVQDIFGLAYRHHIRIPTDFTLLGKCLVTLEGVIQTLDPDLSMVELARPFGTSLMRQRLSPNRLAAKTRRQARTLLEAVDSVPRDAARVLSLLARGRLVVRWATEGDERLGRQVARSARAAVLAAAGLAAAVLAAVALLARAVRPTVVPSDTPSLLLAALSAVLFWLAARNL